MMATEPNEPTLSAPTPVVGAPPVPRWVLAVSAVVCVVVGALILGPRPDGVAGALDVSALPWVNAGINTVTTALLIAGFVAIRLRRVALHRALMTSALGFSALFLVSYVVYHWFSAGPTRYEGPGRALYLVMLGTHVVLAAVILPAALTTWLRGFGGQIAAHRRIAPATLGAWLYVSITGVLITWMAHG
jgi:putative membrane protein